MTDWINQRCGTKFTEEDLLHVKNFSLIWNVFEGTICENNFTVDRIEGKLLDKDIEIKDFTDILTYFKNRYVTDGTINDRFAYLNFRRNDRQPLVKDVLLGVNTDPKDIILAVTIIVYRFRNNLFHGLKDIQRIDRQNENFRYSNAFLKTLLNYY